MFQKDSHDSSERGTRMLLVGSIMLIVGGLVAIAGWIVMHCAKRLLAHRVFRFTPPRRLAGS